MVNLILAINPGSTNTKIGLFQDEDLLFKETVEHHDLDRFESILGQKDLRIQTVLDVLQKHSYTINQLSAVVGRGGLLPPVHTGGYRVNERMKELLLGDGLAPHASNLGGILADEIAQMAEPKLPAFIYDAVSANEFPPIAQVTGLPEITRRSFCHVLNSRAAAIRYAELYRTRYDAVNLLVAHLGGGITISVHQQGSIVDSLADDNGPFAPERAGSIPLLDLIDLCYSGLYTKEEMKKKIRGGGGLKAYLGTADCRELVRRMEEGDAEARFMLDVQAYQIAKGIGLLAPVLKGKCEAIILTGGLAHVSYITAKVTEYVAFIAPVVIYAGEFELEALAGGVLRILRDQEPIHELE